MCVGGGGGRGWEGAHGWDKLSRRAKEFDHLRFHKKQGCVLTWDNASYCLHTLVKLPCCLPSIAEASLAETMVVLL